MPKRDDSDAVVVGAGPNGLAAAITLGRRFNSVLLLEAAKTIGGGVRSAALTLPGFIHDVCSTVQPLSLASPFFRQLDLAQYGLEWIQPEIPLAHPFEDGTALSLHRSLEVTGDVLGSDGEAYKDLLTPFVENHEKLFSDILAPLHFPRNPFLIGRFAMGALHSVKNLVERKFRSARTRAFFSGLAAHAMIPLENTGTAAFGIVLATLAHAVGWPIIKGGSQKLADALADHFRGTGGEIVTGKTIFSLDDLPKANYYFFDVTPRQLLNIKGLGLSENYRRRLGRFRYGPGVYKVDCALNRPIPW
ncbi:MAG: NAD(P)/FAD-dependent oxidoreductase, partial [Syntrophales bacterium LBB04]|nr:NAD(P)/FAD-dependent oxidoreductase [Syntrophales bacterium LBB04]